MNKKLLFLYPIKEYMEDFNTDTIRLLNKVIDFRYRQKGYQIYYATFPDIRGIELSLEQKDKVIKANTPYWSLAYRCRYPNEYKLLKHLGETDHLVICGFHLPDCIKKVARAALKNKINTIIDMDLCELFPAISIATSFDASNYNEEYTKFLLKESMNLEPEYKAFLNDNDGLNSIEKKLKIER